MIEYPRIPRQLNRSIKLHEKDITKILDLRKKGFSQRSIAKELGVSKFAIAYWLKTPEQRSVESKKYRETYKHKRDKVAHAEGNKKVKQHRMEIFPEKVRKFNNFQKLKNFNKKPSRMLKTYLFHKNKIDILLEIEPLLILIK